MALELRAAPLPPDLQYCLDSGLEEGHITGGTHAALWCYGSIAELDRIYNEPRPGRGWERISPLCQDLESYGQHLMMQMEPAIAVAMQGASTVSFLRALASYGEFVCGQAFEDAVWGGSMLPRHHARMHRDVVHRRLMGRLQSADFPKRAVRVHHHETGYTHLVALWERMGRRLPPISQDGFKLLDALLHDQQLRYRERMRVFYQKHRPSSREVRRNRRAVVRAATVAAAVLGSAAVSAFARGEAVRIDAGDIALRVTLAGSISASGHGALKIGLADGDTHLSGLCIYQELPALDQLASLALHAKAGGVAEILQAGNLYNTAPAAFTHPMLLAKKKPVELDVVNPFGAYDFQRAMINTFCELNADRFRRRLFIDVLGRQGPTAWKLWLSFQKDAPK